jgi:hypothetical protein
MNYNNYLNYKSSNYLHSSNNSHYCKYISQFNTLSRLSYLLIISNQIGIKSKLNLNLNQNYISCTQMDIANNHLHPNKTYSDNYVMCIMNLAFVISTPLHI